MGFTARYRPQIPGGSRIMARTNIPVIPFDKGTLGGWVVDRESGRPVLLSNKHVMPGAKKGLEIWQPDRREDDLIGEVLRVSAVHDAAIGRPGEESFATRELHGIGQYQGFGMPVVDMEVVMAGAESGAGEGKITSVTGQWKGQRGMHIEVSDWGVKGDSGSLIVCKDTRQVVGLYAGTTASHRCAVFISDVQETLNID
ncbi:MAG TPA: hypothetical protein VFQ76_18005, partial [Longimicrobiaceae bacterium]|nr:hypothetical protein [Longimicrobiaceae bacterium]